MTLSQNVRHRRAAAAAAAHRREPAPQLGFDPTAVFGTHSTDNVPAASSSTEVPVTVTASPSSSVTASSSAPATTSATTSSTSTTVSSTTVPSTATTSTTPVVTPTTSQTTSVHITTAATQTVLKSVSVSRTSASITSSAAATTSAAADNSSGISTGSVVGGIGAGIVAIAAIGFAITYFIRRSKRNNHDADDFRRSAVMLEDPPTHDDTINRGFNPRPPTMIERHLASPAPTFGTQYGHPGPAYTQDQYAVDYSENGAGYGASFQSFAPGQVMNTNNNYPSPISAHSAHPMYPNSAYAQSPFSPASPNEQYAYPENVQSFTGGNGVAAYPVLTRQGSNHSQEASHQPGSPNTLRRESLPANDYVDLNRSSVSPYQAAQYVEISRRLNADVPAGLHTAELDRELPPVPPQTDSDASPFADPSSAPPSPGGQYAIDRRHLEQPLERRASGDSISSQTQALDFPVPPSPVHTPTSRYRIDSMPPSLPEINIESRVSVSSYPMLTARDSGAPSGMLSAGLATGTGSRFPTTPSPLASSFGMPSPPPAAASATFAEPGPVPTPRQPSADAQDEKKRGTMYSMYDPEDAYGGI